MFASGLIACSTSSWHYADKKESLNFWSWSSQNLPAFFATVVKTLLLSDTFLSPFPIEYAQASDVLAACGGVQSLQWWTAEELPTVALSSISQLPLQRLSLNLYDVARMIASPVPPAWLTSLTHLDVSVSILIMSLEVSYLEQLRHLPRLTHVALGPLESGTELLCATCPSLQILVILILPGTTLDNANLFDPRVIVTEFPADSKKEWEARHFGLPNIWTYAEGVVAERKRLALPRGD
ncbi:hypothetical protein MSAN_02236000 [Mycena sanguinolenta]|uniref:Uncharacterized protein n=1 Tax=Mycena sanguinolenta TaxID=230812 RepID=A0A8H6XBL9_9AGAR|nr:hypothetical protein MSAN_02236000 [Mycena sanguinolenta]